MLHGAMVPEMSHEPLDPTALVDTLLEATVLGSFTRVGYEVRSRLDCWDSIGEHCMRGRTVVMTGATSGLGAAAARLLAEADASLFLVARDTTRARRTVDELDSLGAGEVSFVIADIAEMEAVRGAAEEILARCERIDVLIHNAGSLDAGYDTNSDGRQRTVASQVYGPFLLTSILLAALRAAAPGRVITMSSGGMYTQRLDVDVLEMSPERYRGSVAYARAKRAQVALNELWSNRVTPKEVVFHALHPGWADTPGVAESLPRFRRIMGPLLRTPTQGADTLVWLAADDTEVPTSTGRFWHDRRPRCTHLPGPLGPGETDAERQRLWQACERATGLEGFLDDEPTRTRGW